MGHRKVVEERVEELIDHAGKLGIQYITFWAFSTENWERPTDEVNSYMQLFRWAFAHKAKVLAERGARLKIIGDISRFDADIQEGMRYWEEKTKNNTKIMVIFALNYSGRDEMVRAINKFPISNIQFPIQEADLIKCLDTHDIPDPDLIIRPGGEQRLSGFMLWQSEYSEFYFTDVLMPDFDSKQFDLAMEEFSKRQRRKGK
jgi:undecaprenyl diphosphate synthase